MCWCLLLRFLLLYFEKWIFEELGFGILWGIIVWNFWYVFDVIFFDGCSGLVRFDWNMSENLWIYCWIKVELISLLEEEFSELLGSFVVFKNWVRIICICLYDFVIVFCSFFVVRWYWSIIIWRFCCVF